ncbi:hypothetical protein F5Y17DRAFT_55879 [Xylariaceae sp. FL0594]|nr:hypothetical protein F5Y17DRAFT_55879 [Xylariaceae sp. FL0594]
MSHHQSSNPFCVHKIKMGSQVKSEPDSDVSYTELFVRSLEDRPERVAVPTREEVIAICPSPQASPMEVREWLANYLSYRGLPREMSECFIWRGVELHMATIGELTDAFKQHCKLLKGEAEMVARDVCFIIQQKSIPPRRTPLRIYVESVYGKALYTILMQHIDPNSTYFEVLVSHICWVGFIILQFVLIGLVRTTIDFLSLMVLPRPRPISNP